MRWSLWLLLGCGGGTKEGSAPEETAEIDDDDDVISVLDGESAIRAVIRAQCEYGSTCRGTTFSSLYADIEDQSVDTCVDDQVALLERYGVLGAFCEVDEERLADCLEGWELGEATCLPNRVDHEACAEVLDCSGGVALGTSYWTFAAQYFDAYCDAGCTANLDAICDDVEIDEPDDGTCAFNAEAAFACVDASEWACDALFIDIGDTDTYPVGPSACNDVCG